MTFPAYQMASSVTTRKLYPQFSALLYIHTPGRGVCARTQNIKRSNLGNLGQLQSCSSLQGGKSETYVQGWALQ